MAAAAVGALLLPLDAHGTICGTLWENYDLDNAFTQGEIAEGCDESRSGRWFLAVLLAIGAVVVAGGALAIRLIERPMRPSA